MLGSSVETRYRAQRDGRGAVRWQPIDAPAVRRPEIRTQRPRTRRRTVRPLSVVGPESREKTVSEGLALLNNDFRATELVATITRGK